MADRYRNLPLNPMRAFAIAAQHKSFTAAAKHMGISQVAVSRQIAILENYLGAKLFERGVRSAKLTEIGRSFSRDIVGLFNELEAAAQRALLDERENSIQLRTYPTVAHHWLLPRLSGFLNTRPECRVQLDTAVEPLDFRGTHLDLALQLGQGNWRDSRSRKLFDEVIDVVCSPGYAAQFNHFADPTDLTRAQFLHARYRREEWRYWADAAGLELPHGRSMFFDSSLLAYGAARDGLGLAIGQIDILRNELDAGRLVRPFDRPVVTDSAFYLVWPTLKSVSAHTRHFVDWILTSCGERPQFAAQATGRRSHAPLEGR